MKKNLLFVFLGLLTAALLVTGCGDTGKASKEKETVAQPTANPAGGARASGDEITLSTDTAGASIYYTQGATAAATADPTSSSTLYSAGSKPKIEEGKLALKAIAVKDGMNNSAVLTATYTIDVSIVAQPTADPAGGEHAAGTPITLSTATAGASVYYEQGATEAATPAPTKSSALYEAGSKPVITADKLVLKAFAVKDDMTDSGVLTATYTIETVVITVEKPSANPAGSEVDLDTEIALTGESGAAIYYELGATEDLTAEPTIESALYSESNKPKIAMGKAALKAVAVIDGHYSDILVETYALKLAAANAADFAALMDDIKVAGGGSYAVTLTGDVEDFAGVDMEDGWDITIHGNGNKISWEGDDLDQKLFYVGAGARLTLEDVILENNTVKGLADTDSGNDRSAFALVYIDGGTVEMKEGAELTSGPGFFGVYLSPGTSGETSTHGHDGAFILSGGKISGNYRAVVANGYADHRTVTMTGGEISDNTDAGVYLGGVDTAFTMTGGVIKDSARGVWLDGIRAVADVTGGEISGNANHGIVSWNPTDPWNEWSCTVNIGGDAVISGNGEGIRLNGNSDTVTMTGGEITDVPGIHITGIDTTVSVTGGAITGTGGNGIFSENRDGYSSCEVTIGGDAVISGFQSGIRLAGAGDTVTMTGNGTIESVQYGILVWGGTDTNINIDGGFIKDNSEVGITLWDGNNNTITMSGGEISGNVQQGIRMNSDDNTVIMSGGEISGSPHGILIGGNGNTVTMSGGEISGNSVYGINMDNIGDGITVSMSGGEISGNGDYGVRIASKNSTFEKQLGGIIYGSDADEDKKNATGAAVFFGGGETGTIEASETYKVTTDNDGAGTLE